MSAIRIALRSVDLHGRQSVPGGLVNLDAECRPTLSRPTCCQDALNLRGCSGVSVSSDSRMLWTSRSRASSRVRIDSCSDR